MADPSQTELLNEAYSRGILPPEKKALYEEAQKRGLLKSAPSDSEPSESGIDTAARKGPQLIGEVISGSANNMEDRLQKAREALAVSEGKDPTVDYDTGLSFMDRIFLKRADNDKERKLYLTHKYGDENVKQDKNGTFYVVKDGKKIATTGGSMISNLGASVLSSATPLAGMTVGSDVGAGVGGPFGAVIGGGIGAGGGYALDEATKYFMGLSSKTPGEEATATAKEVLGGMGGEAGGRLITGAAGKLTKGYLPQWFSGATPETERLTAQTLKGGAVPPIKSTLPSARISQFHQSLSEKLVGPYTDERNAAFIDSKIKGILRESGVPENKIEDTFKEIVNPQSAVSTTELGQDIQKSIRAHVDSLTATSEREMKNANDYLDHQLNHLNTITNRFKPGDLGVDVSDSIIQARQDFSKMAGKAYARADSIVGDATLVPTKPISREADRILNSLPKTKEGTPIMGDPRVLKTLADLKQLPDQITFKDAQRIRSTLGQFGEMTDLTPGVTKKNFDDLRQSVNTAFNQAMSDPKAASARKLLTAADKFYSEGIQKFQDVTVNRLVKNAENGMAPDPSVIANQIIKPGYEARLKTIKSMIPQETWKRVAGADFDNMIAKSTRTESGNDLVKGKLLLDQINRRGSLMDTVYGPQTAKEIKTYAERLAARDGELPSSALKSSDNFVTSLKAADDAEKKLNDFMKNNFLSTLADLKKMPDDALGWIVQPKQEQRLKDAITFFGEKSPQVQAIRQTALRQLMSRAVTNTEIGSGRAVEGDGLEKALRGFTEKQQEMLFPNGLADDIRLLAKQAKFLFPERSSDMAAGLAAGAIKVTMPFSLPAYGWGAGWGWILSRPSTIRFLALGLNGDGPVRTATRESMRLIFRNAGLGLVSDTGGEQEKQQ